MPLTSLAARLSTLPRILAGPMLRRTEPGGVTVFVALREKRKVTMRVYTGADAGGKGQGKVAEGTRSTVPLGKNLHVVAVTAKPPGQELKWGTLYVYNLFFGTHGNDSAPVAESGTNLFSPGMLLSDADEARKLLLYRTTAAAPTLPSFPLPPDDLNKLRIVHGSCRKAHGPGRDMLPTLDGMVEQVVTKPTERPQQLFLTGDQIYADDVADGLLALLTDAGNTLLGLDQIERVPLKATPRFSVTDPAVTDLIRGATPVWLRPGERQELIERAAGFTSDHAKSHLLTRGEFFAQYLFAWSDVLWPAELPTFDDVLVAPIDFDAEEKARKKYGDERSKLMRFRDGLSPRLRRALAHVPSYMIFDDHEVTDDWFINEAWCQHALGEPLGRHVIQNGLLAFAIFQAWGNNPVDFEPGTPGGSLLTEAAKLTASPTSTARANLAKYIGPPSTAAIARDKGLLHGAESLDWHFAVGGPKHEVLVLDSRTWRGYSDGAKASPALINEQGFEQQIPDGAASGDTEITFVVAPAPFLGFELAELVQELGVSVASRVAQDPLAAAAAPFVPNAAVRLLVKNGVALADAEAWSFSPKTFETLLSRLMHRNRRVVVLSGDVHYASSAQLSYWAMHRYGHPTATPRVGALAQLTSSALHNEIADIGSELLTLVDRYEAEIAGWHVPPTIWSEGKPFSPRGNPPTAFVTARARVSTQPDWRYRIRRVLAQQDATPVPRILDPTSWSRRNSLETMVAAAQVAKADYFNVRVGRGLVGRNNIGEVRLHWGEREDKQVSHRLYWVRPDHRLAPYTEYRIGLAVSIHPLPLQEAS